MLTKNFNSLYWQKTVSFCQTSDEIINRMKDSDFFVIDKKGNRRMIGMKYDKKTMASPKVTFVAMRQELPFAKQIAFTLGKIVIYDDDACRAFLTISEVSILQEEIIVFVPACMLKPCINVAEKLTARHREENMNITITVKTETKTHTFTVRLSQCKPALAFAEFLRSGDCTVKMHDDGSCWSGTLAASLFGSDVQESSEPKGICLEQDELCLEEPFVLSDGTKAANWTLIGKLQGVAQDKVRAIIGSGDVTAIFQ